MTFRARSAPTTRSRSGSSGNRQTLLVNVGFVLVIVAALLILVGAGAASWYGDHFGAVASVNGQTITRDQLRDEAAIDAFRLDQTASRIRNETQAGHITESVSAQEIAQIEQQRAQTTLEQNALEALIDDAVTAKLAADQGVSVSDADIDARLTTEATTPEFRHVWTIAVRPEVTTGASAPTDAQRAAAKAKADAALADLASGKKWEDVAKAVSTDGSAPSGGDLGWLQQADANQDKPFMDAVFAAQPNTPTAVVTGDDGTYRIGRVTEVAPAQVDKNWQQKITDAGISMDTYRKAVRADVTHTKLAEAMTTKLVDQPTLQRKVAEIYIPERADGGTGDEVHVWHILYTPNDVDPTASGASPPPSSDPSWQAARAKAQATYDKLQAYTGNPAELEAQFKAIAKAESDDVGSKSSGGDLPYETRNLLDTGFGDAVFKAGLKKDDLIGPIQSQFGWHVILFQDRRPNPEGRINDAQLEANQTGASFADVARKYSEGAEKDQGGDIGWVARYQLDQQLEDAIFAAPLDKVSNVLDVPGDGFYLFYVSAEQMRAADGEQAVTLRKSAFSNWYDRQKGDTKQFTIQRDISFSSS